MAEDGQEAALREFHERLVGEERACLPPPSTLGPGWEGFLGPLRSQLWASVLINAAGLKVELAPGSFGLNAESSMVAVLTEHEEAVKYYTSDFDQLSWPGDDKTFGVYVSLNSSQLWNIYLPDEQHSSGSRGSTRNRSPQKMFSTGTWYETAAYDSEGNAVSTIGRADGARIVGW